MLLDCHIPERTFQTALEIDSILSNEIEIAVIWTLGYSVGNFHDNTCQIFTELSAT